MLAYVGIPVSDTMLFNNEITSTKIHFLPDGLTLKTASNEILLDTFEKLMTALIYFNPSEWGMTSPICYGIHRSYCQVKDELISRRLEFDCYKDELHDKETIIRVSYK